MEYYINYNTGAGNEYFNGTLAEAKAAADKGAAYTQVDIIISKKDPLFEISGEWLPVARRRWYSGEFDPELYEDGEDADVIRFGNFGYFDEWYDY